MTTLRRTLIALLLPLFAIGATAPAAAQPYPNRTVTIINPYSPDGGVDPVARLVAAKLTERLGQQVIVDNKVGAAGMISAGLVALAKSKPGALSYASPGNGTLQHLIAARLQSLAGVQMLHVPYKERLVTDLLGHQVDSAFLGAHVVAPHVKAGKLRALAVTSTARMPSAPEVATAAEQGLAGLEFTQWFGAYAPAGTPESIVRLLNREMVAVLALPDVRAALAEQGAEAVGSTPEAFGKFLKAEIDRFGVLVKQSGATVEQ